jgi:opacity protein-like surface antigen
LRARIDEMPTCSPSGTISTYVPGLGQLTNIYLTLELLKTTGLMKPVEARVADGVVTFQSSDLIDPVQIGIALGYNFAPWNNAIRVGPFLEFTFLNQSFNHIFPGGTFLGTTSRWSGTAGVKLGAMTMPGLFVYGLGGASVLNQDLNINFGGPFVTTSNTTVSGGTLGLGAEFQPASQVFSVPVSVFVQYQHTWWQDAHLNNPAASPGFNYTFHREDDTVKFGLNFYLGAPGPAPSSVDMPVKAPRLK